MKPQATSGERAKVVDDTLCAIGAERSVVRLDQAAGLGANNFEYSDLLASRSEHRVSAVVEKDGSPLVYVSAGIDNSDAAMRLARKLGNRGETAILLNVRADGEDLHAEAWPCRLEASHCTPLNLRKFADARSVLGDLQEGLWGTADNAYQEQALRDLLVNSVAKVSSSFLKARGQRTTQGDRGNEVLALVGRALFTRFLLDRYILTPATAPALFKMIGEDGEDAFATAQKAAATCKWLDDTFNGDFMPLPAPNGYEAYFAQLANTSPEALAPIGWIVGRTDAGGQLQLWDRLDFAHIPAGTLSEVYEDYARSKAPNEAKHTSIHFTPRHVARTMVRQTLAGLPQNEAALAKVLDPAVGAAVFLSLAYRELARLHAIRNQGAWPDTWLLRSILYGQLQGLDINADALNLAALTLYLTSIELDANPVPPEKLKFESSLIGTVLRKVGDHAKPNSVDDLLGSLRDLPDLKGKFDIVVGNPPWTSVSFKKFESAAKDPLGRLTADLANARLRKLGNESPGYLHPDKVPDVAFLWKATEWVREGGVISLILHQRLLSKQSARWRQTRRQLFEAMELSGFLDATEFANHKQLLWPGIEAPFCIVFAKNHAPAPDHKALFLSLAVEPVLTHRRQLRIDPMSTWRIDADDFDRPGGLIARTRGSELDAAFLERLQARCEAGYKKTRSSLRRPPMKSLGDCVEAWASLRLLRGIKTGASNARMRDWMERFPSNAKWLEARSDERMAGEIAAAKLTVSFKPIAVKSTPPPDWFKPPMLLITQKMGEDNEFVRSAIVQPSPDDAPVVYPFAWVGVPFKAGDAQALLAAQYCAVWVNSSFYAYFQTLTSTQLGFGIKALLSEDILRTPIVEPSVALQADRTSAAEVKALFDKLTFPKPGLQSEIDAWVAKVAGLDAAEQRLMQDTLSVAYPIGNARQSGRSWVPNAQFKTYVKTLSAELAEMDAPIDLQSIKALDTGDALPGWRFVSWKSALAGGAESTSSTGEVATLVQLDARSLEALVRDKYPQGEIWATTRHGDFVFGQLALKRLWLPSRAVLAAQVIVAWADQHRA